MEELKIKNVSPPAELPVLAQKEDWENASFFGETTFSAGLSSRKDIFGIKRKDRQQHLYIIGKTGVGKTKLIEILAQVDILKGFGTCVIDPHGDLINTLLDSVPEERIDDVVLIDPTDMEFPIGFNPIGNIPPEARHFVASGLIEAFKKQFGSQWTPRIEHVCRFTILALLEYEKATFADITNMLTDPKFRQKVIPHIKDAIVRHFWTLEFASWSERFDNEAIIPLVNRIGQFLSNPLVRNIFSQRENKIDFDKLINSKKIILINLSKGVIGEDNTELFGSLIITSIYQATMRRAAMPESARFPFYLYVDEFQNVATQTFLNLFSESRKYGMCITVSHQHLGQVEDKIRETIFGNVGTIISFRIGAEDAKLLNNEFSPVCTVEDLLNLNVREFVVKLSIDGQSMDPFSGKTLTVTESNNSLKERIIESSRSKYANAVSEVEAELDSKYEENTADDSYDKPLV